LEPIPRKAKDTVRDPEARKLVLFPEVDEPRVRAIRETLDASGAADVQVANCHDETEAAREIVDADALFGKITPGLLPAARRLRWVQSATASLEHYVFPALVEHPCVLTNMRGLFSDVIADHVFGYILCFARNLHRYLRQQQQHRWAPIGGEGERSSFAGGPCFVSGMDRAHQHLSDLTLGIVGLGHIGAEVARRGLAFGMRVLSVDPVVHEAPAGAEPPWPLERLDDLLAASDYVVICAPHTPRTAGLFRRDRFQRMKSTGVLINIGRGAIVSLEDLVEALRAGDIGGAALDVFETEPLPADHPLWDFENVILTPHVAACSVHLAERHLATLLGNLRRYVVGEPLANKVNKHEWY
jgi:phosphoglycerate dehydrogenase-like enzyme